MDWLFRYSDPSLDWNYAAITLTVRFVGVFVVMIVMQIALQISARVIKWIERSGTSDETGAEKAGSLDLGVAQEGHIEGATIAAVGLALEMESRTSPRITAPAASRWATAGRMQQLDRTP